MAARARKRGKYETATRMFHRVTRRLLNQQERAEDDMGDCVLRTPDDKVCAIGALIPKNKYRKGLECEIMTVLHGDFNTKAARVTGIRTPRKAELGRALMGVHDEVEPAEWREAFLRVARDFGIKARI